MTSFGGFRKVWSNQFDFISPLELKQSALHIDTLCLTRERMLPPDSAWSVAQMWHKNETAVDIACGLFEQSCTLNRAPASVESRISRECFGVRTTV